MDSPDSARVPAPTPHLSRHRAPPISLPADPVESASLVLRYIQTAETGWDRSAAIEAMAGRVQRLSDPDTESQAVVAELAGHAALLDALFQRFAVQAVQAVSPDHKVKFAKLALSAQSNHLRTIIAIEGLKQQNKGRARVSYDIENDSDGG